MSKKLTNLSERNVSKTLTNREGIRKEYYLRELARLERTRDPIQRELDSVDQKIKETKKKLEELKDVSPTKLTFF